MGKTYKDQANYFRHKDKRNEIKNPIVKKKSDVMDTLEYEGIFSKGHRFGNNRKIAAEVRVKTRRAEKRAFKNFSNDS